MSNIFNTSSPEAVYDNNSRILDEIESKEFLKEKIDKENRYIPNIDFRKPENFVRYGSAEKYYEDSIARIYKTFPFDGSAKELLEWENRSSYLDLYIYNNLYPRFTGYVNLNPGVSFTTGSLTLASTNETFQFGSSLQDITFSGNPKSDNKYSTSYDIIEKQDSHANVYDSVRGHNARLSKDGNTVEFWWKLNSRQTNTICLFDMVSSQNSGRISIEAVPSATTNSDLFRVTSKTSSTGFSRTINTVPSDFSSGWNHYVFAFGKASTKIYINGELHDTIVQGNLLDEDTTGNISCSIGSYLQTPDSNITFTSSQKYGQSDSLFDEFRFWNSERTEKQIKRNWFSTVKGGVNSDDSNISLGVYYKFNEGKTNNSSFDSIVLDYSGRQSDATINNYSSASRTLNTGPIENEYKDPVIYPTHIQVVELLAKYKKIGNLYDQSNNSKMYHMFPDWVTEEDTNSGSEILKNLIQIMCSYLDTLYLQIEKLPLIVNNPSMDSHLQDSSQNFSKKLLENKGIIVPELFLESTLIEKFNGKDKNLNFNNDISLVKNTIYNNIYNNIDGILKSKGTQKSLRNLFRCFGLDEELLKIRVYAENEKIRISKDRKYQSSVKKRYANFFPKTNHDAVIYSSVVPSQNNSIGVITGSDGTTDLDFSSYTFECETFFPKRYTYDGADLLDTDHSFVTSSIAGINEAVLDFTDNSQTTANNGNFRIRFIKESIDSTSGYFSLSFDGISQPMTSSVYDVYDNQKWNLSVRLYEKSKYSDYLSSGNNPSYEVSFSGYNVESGITQEEFVLKSDITQINAVQALTTNKRLFIGAERNNIDGLVINYSDVQVTSVRYWVDYLTDEVLLAHANSPLSYGLFRPTQDAYFYDSELTDKKINKSDLLVLNWDFRKVESESGAFYTYDRSLPVATSVPVIDNKTQKLYAGKFYFPSLSSPTLDSMLEARQIGSQNTIEPDYLRDTELVNILTTEEQEVFKTNDRSVSHRISIEKSYSAVMNDEIMKHFAGMKHFGDLIGRPVDKYRIKYKELDYFKRKIFSLFNKDGSADSDPDIEKFLNYYKWIDSAITSFINQMLPTSSGFSDNIFNVIESHLLERNKYQWTYDNRNSSKIYNAQGNLVPVEEKNYGIPRPDDYTAIVMNDNRNTAAIRNPDTAPSPKLEYIYVELDQGGTHRLLSNETVSIKYNNTIISITAGEILYYKTNYPDTEILL